MYISLNPGSANGSGGRALDVKQYYHSMLLDGAVVCGCTARHGGTVFPTPDRVVVNGVIQEEP
jgi:hypothetical protein